MLPVRVFFAFLLAVLSFAKSARGQSSSGALQDIGKWNLLSVLPCQTNDAGLLAVMRQYGFPDFTPLNNKKEQSSCVDLREGRVCLNTADRGWATSYVEIITIKYYGEKAKRKENKNKPEIGLPVLEAGMSRKEVEGRIGLHKSVVGYKYMYDIPLSASDAAGGRMATLSLNYWPDELIEVSISKGTIQGYHPVTPPVTYPSAPATVTNPPQPKNQPVKPATVKSDRPDCGLCHGKGKLPSVEVTCTVCGGSAHVKCTGCDGRGYYLNYEGKISGTCGSCSGSGKVRCGGCDAFGKMRYYNVTCTRCGGSGKQ